jgi:hypothetical protein
METNTQGETTEVKVGTQNFESLSDAEETVAPSVDERDKLIIELKKELKESRSLTKESTEAIVALKDAISKGTLTRSEAKDELDQLADEFGVDPAFVKKFEGVLTKRNASALSGDVEIIRKTAEEKRQIQIDADLSSRFNAAIEEDPRFKDIANRDVVINYIKTAILPRSDAAKHTMASVLEDFYGNVIPKTRVESPNQASQNAPERVDYTRMSEDDYKRIHNKMKSTGEVDDEYTNSLLERAGVSSRRNK